MLTGDVGREGCDALRSGDGLALQDDRALCEIYWNWWVTGVKRWFRARVRTELTDGVVVDSHHSATGASSARMMLALPSMFLTRPPAKSAPAATVLAC